MDELKIVLIQSDIFWEDAEKNLESCSEIITSQVHFPVDIIFLPEMFNTGFTGNVKRCAEEMDGQSIRFLRETAHQKNCCLITSLLIHERGRYFNRQVTVFPDGTISHSDKRHLFRLSDEFDNLTKREKKIIGQVQGWNILPLICYDLRFPVWSKNNFREGKYDYDLLVYISNWPASRSYVWKSLIKARAIENLAFVIGVNRIGCDGFGTDHSGDSMVVDPKGEILWESKSGIFDTGVITLQMSELRQVRESFPIGQDWDQFQILL
jgi:omega-amidase